MKNMNLFFIKKYILTSSELKKLKDTYCYLRFKYTNQINPADAYKRFFLLLKIIIQLTATTTFTAFY